MARQLAKAVFGLDGDRSSPYLAVFDTETLYRWSWRIRPIAFPVKGLSAEVIQLPDMTALHGVFQGPQNRIAGSGKIVTWIAEK